MARVAEACPRAGGGRGTTAPNDRPVYKAGVTRLGRKRLSERRFHRGGRIAVFVVEGVGCGGCAEEARSALLSRYGAPRRGVVAVDSPAHADALLLCGTMLPPLLQEVQRLAESLSEPWICLRLGDCGVEAGAIFPGHEVTLCGCPPSPEMILESLEQAWNSRPQKGIFGLSALVEEEA